MSLHLQNVRRCSIHSHRVRLLCCRHVSSVECCHPQTILASILQPKSPKTQVSGSGRGLVQSDHVGFIAARPEVVVEDTLIAFGDYTAVLSDPRLQVVEVPQEAENVVLLLEERVVLGGDVRHFWRSVVYHQAV